MMPSAQARVLVAGIGNIFLGDDGFGVEVARRLAGCPLPDDVRVVDFGVRGIHLAYELLDRQEGTTILVDATARGGKPGTVYLIEPDQSTAVACAADAHSLTPDAVFGFVRALGGSPGHLLIVGCEPADVAENMGLSAPVASAVDEAVELILSLVRDRGTSA